MFSLYAAAYNGAAIQKTDNVPGWFSNLVERLNLEKWFRTLGVTSAEVLQMLYFFGGAFFIGFAFKRYFKFLIGCTIVILTLSIYLESQGALKIDWPIVKSLVGIDPATTDLNNLWLIVSSWVKKEIYAFIAGVLGLIVGYKLG